MTESLQMKLRSNESLLFYQEDFKDFLEMHLANLRKKSLEQGLMFDVDATQRHRADKNFSMLCNIAKISYPLHWITMRVNGLKFNAEYRAENDNIYYVDENYLNELILTYHDSKALT